HIIDIQNNRWSGYEEPFISKALNEILRLPGEPPSFKQIKKDIEDLRIRIEDLPTLRQIEEVITNLKDLKELKI
ncbi:9254_t:CDS:1, partial [Racocetra fulgida]